MRCVVICIVLSLACGCGKRGVDGTTAEGFKESIEDLKKPLSEGKKREFENAITTIIVMKDIDNTFQAAADSEGTERGVDAARAIFTGKTVDEVIAMAQEIKQRQAQKQLQGEIADMEKNQVNALAAHKALAGFEVKRSRFSWVKTMFDTEPMIEVTVQNGLLKPVSKVHFEAQLTSPGRSVPWVKDSFSYAISGGLEPGEEATWKFAPNQFGEWGHAPTDRTNMVLTLTVTQLDDADGKSMAAVEFTQFEVDRLKSLQKQLVD
jgi:hypothetical protein